MRHLSVIVFLLFSVSTASAGFADFNLGNWSLGPKKGRTTPSDPATFSVDLTSTAKVITPTTGTGPATFTGGGQWVADNAGVLQFVAAGNPAIPGSRIAANVGYDTLVDGTPIAGIKGILLEPASTNRIVGYNAIPADALSAERVANGNFTVDLSGWTNTTNWASTPSGAQHTPGATTSPTLAGAAIAGRIYTVAVTVVGMTAGSVAVKLGSGTSRSTNGTFSENITSSGTTATIVPTSDFDGTVTGVSVKEIVLAIGTTATNTRAGAVSGMTLSGDPVGTLSVVDATSELTASGLISICSSGKAYRLDNSAASVATTASVSGTTGNTSPTSLQVWVRRSGASGSSVMRMSTGFEGSIALPAASGTFARLKSENITPGATNRQLTIVAGPGDVVTFVLPQMEVQPFSTSPIVTVGATATRAVTALAVPVANLRPNNISGAIDWTPTMTSSTVRWLWGAYKDASNYYGVFRDGTAGTLVFRKRAGGVDYDASYTVAVTPGTTYKVGWRMGAAGVDIFVNGVKGTGNANATDAAVPVAWQIGADGNGGNQGAPQLKNLRIWWEDATDAKMITRTQ